MTKRVLIRAPVLSQSGYGVHARLVLNALKSREDLFDLHLINLNWGKTSWLWEDTEERRWIDQLLLKTISYMQTGGQFDLSFQVTIPNEWEKIAPINIGCTAGIEATRITPQWVEKSYLMDKIIFVSNFGKSNFQNTVYTQKDPSTGEERQIIAKGPLEVVNYAFKEFEAAEIDLKLECDFNFLVVSQWSPRKNIEDTVRWFIEEFIDQKVGLIIKTSIANNSYNDFVHTKLNIENILKDPAYQDRKCKVHILHGYMKQEELSALYQHPKVKALINIAHGEGFGLPIFEAAGYGLPIITIGWSGQTDFLYVPERVKGSKKKRLAPKFAEVDYTLGPISQEAVWEGVLHADAHWAYAKQGSYKMKLREVYKRHSVYKKRAATLKKHIRNNFTAEKQYAKFCSLVEEYAPDDFQWLSEVEDILQEYE